MAEAPNAELVCRWQEWQWQIYSAKGFGVGVLNLTAPHWQLASILVVSQDKCLSAKPKTVFRIREPIGSIGPSREGTGSNVTAGGDECPPMTWEYERVQMYRFLRKERSKSSGQQFISEQQP